MTNVASYSLKSPWQEFLLHAYVYKSPLESLCKIVLIVGMCARVPSLLGLLALFICLFLLEFDKSESILILTTFTFLPCG